MFELALVSCDQQSQPVTGQHPEKRQDAKTKG